MTKKYLFFIIILIIFIKCVKNNNINNKNCKNKLINYNKIKDKLKTGDIIITKRCKYTNIKNYFYWLLFKIIYNSDYHHSIIILRIKDKLYGIDFVNKNYEKDIGKKYSKISNFINIKTGLRIFDLEKYLKYYSKSYGANYKVFSIKKKINNKKLLKIVIKYRNFEFFYPITLKKIFNGNILNCNEFICKILKELKLLKQNNCVLYNPHNIIFNSNYLDGIKFIYS